jgi:hypothetical protein
MRVIDPPQSAFHSAHLAPAARFPSLEKAKSAIEPRLYTCRIQIEVMPGTTMELFEKHFQRDFLKGHGFIRASKERKTNAALAAEGFVPLPFFARR